VRPWTAVLRLKQTEDELHECVCHEGNEQIKRTILSGNFSK
jgi:hypothetical protein